MSARSGATSGVIGAWPIASGSTPASAKNVDELAHIDSASDAVLNVS